MLQFLLSLLGLAANKRGVFVNCIRWVEQCALGGGETYSSKTGSSKSTSKSFEIG